MTTSNTTQQKLLKTGAQLAKKYGLKFSVRQLCTKSNVNLGLFHYYFKNKENFDKELLTAIYEQMMADITPQISPNAKPRENIKNILLGLNRFAGNNRMFLSSLMGEVLSGNKQMLGFLTQNFTKHIALLQKELKRATIRPELKKQPLAALLSLVALPIVFPQIARGLLERVGTNSLPFNADVLKQITDDETQVKTRIELGLTTILGEKK